MAQIDPASHLRLALLLAIAASLLVACASQPEPPKGDLEQYEKHILRNIGG
jgi:outer membrane biogenesis lipoprotein LolB